MHYPAYTQMTQTDIPNYFTYAQKFVRPEHVFLDRASFPNYLHTVAGSVRRRDWNSLLAVEPNGIGTQGWAVMTITGGGQQMECHDACKQCSTALSISTLAPACKAPAFPGRSMLLRSGRGATSFATLNAINHIHNTPVDEHVLNSATFAADAKQRQIAAVSCCSRPQSEYSAEQHLHEKGYGVPTE